MRLVMIELMLERMRVVLMLNRSSVIRQAEILQAIDVIERRILRDIVSFFYRFNGRML